MILKNINQKIELKQFNINEDVKQVLLGSLLGDSSLSKPSKNAYFSCVHSPKQKDYILWKKRIIYKNFKVSVKLYNNKYKNRRYKTYRLSTNCSPFLTYTHSFFYIRSYKPNRKWEKMVNTDILKKLSPLGLGVWYCDDGTYCVRDKSCSLATQGFTYEENLTIKDYFYKKWKIKAHIIEDYNKQYNKSYYKIVFNTEETSKFLNLIKDFIPESMIYKLGHYSDKNKELMESEDERYKAISRKWYQDNHEKALERAFRYRNIHRDLINKKRVIYYNNNLDKSMESGRQTMRKRRKFQRERVNLINHNYYHRNKDSINKERRKRLIEDPEFRERKNRLMMESYYRHREARKEKMRLYHQRKKSEEKQKCSSS
tara:strand:+ start:1338 stop:2450 length:1113 start_codon:yes stop_codon:yes gene_type:complete